MIWREKDALCRRFDKEMLRIEPWGADSLRIRATQNNRFLEEGAEEHLSALLPPEECNAEIETDAGNDRGTIRNGRLVCEICSTGKLIFRKTDGTVLLEEYDRNRFRRRNYEKDPDSALEVAGRQYEPQQGTNYYALTAHFAASDGERFYGMGQYGLTFLNLKGCKLELAQRNSQVSIPFVLSSKGYGFLWNNPAIGYASFGRNRTEWRAESARQLDYWVTAGDNPAEIEEHYADATGHVPMMPSYGTGLWQSKLRYRTQQEVLEIAGEYRKRGLPLDVMVIDFFHWTAQGDWRFDPMLWPDPEQMVKELREMDIELMVSVWPTVEEESENYREMEEKGFLIRTDYGPRLGIKNKDTYLDATNPKAREYVWQHLKKNYYDKGIHLFWLDECEPEISGYPYRNLRFYAGSDLESGNLYPKDFTRMVYLGRCREGEEQIVSLCRCAWAGSQRYGALVWTGDVASNFETLRTQIYAAQSMGIAGIPWWTTDIGGFHGGDGADPVFRECLVRWFEFAVFCPVLRMHGFREPKVSAAEGKTFVAGNAKAWAYTSGSPNELWSYGEEVYVILRKYLRIRERMRPYTAEIMEEAHEKGTPLVRPMFYVYHNEKEAYEAEDQYMFGGELLVAPITEEGAVERTMWFPEGNWFAVEDGSRIVGGRRRTVQAPLDVIPVYAKTRELADLLGERQTSEDPFSENGGTGCNEKSIIRPGWQETDGQEA